jgi:hypothetical protein
MWRVMAMEGDIDVFEMFDQTTSILLLVDFVINST